MMMKESPLPSTSDNTRNDDHDDAAAGYDGDGDRRTSLNEYSSSSSAAAAASQNHHFQVGSIVRTRYPSSSSSSSSSKKSRMVRAMVADREEEEGNGQYQYTLFLEPISAIQPIAPCTTRDFWIVPKTLEEPATAVAKAPQQSEEDEEVTVSPDEIQNLLPFERHLPTTDSHTSIATWKERGDSLLRLGDAAAAASYYEMGLFHSSRVTIGGTVILRQQQGFPVIAEVDCINDGSDGDDDDSSLDVSILSTGEERTVPRSAVLLGVMDTDDEHVQERILLNLSRCMLQLAEMMMMDYSTTTSSSSSSTNRSKLLNAAVLATTLVVTLASRNQVDDHHHHHRQPDSFHGKQLLTDNAQKALVLRINAHIHMCKWPQAKQDAKKLVQAGNEQGNQFLASIDRKQKASAKVDRRLAKEMCRLVQSSTEKHSDAKDDLVEPSSSVSPAVIAKKSMEIEPSSSSLLLFKEQQHPSKVPLRSATKTSLSSFSDPSLYDSINDDYEPPEKGRMVLVAAAAAAERPSSSHHNDSPNSDPNIDMDGILVHLSALLESAGLFGSFSNQRKSNIWQEMADLLEELIVPFSDTKPYHIDKAPSLLRKEEANRKILDALDKFSRQVQVELIEQLQRCHHLAFCSTPHKVTNADAWLLQLSKSLENAVRQQMEAAEQTLRSIDTCIAKMYDTEAPSVLLVLQKAIHRIRKGCLSKQSPPWSTAVSLCHQIASFVEASEDSREWTNAFQNGSAEEALILNQRDMNSINEQQFTSSVMETIVGKNVCDPKVSSLFLVGAEGSGKTFRLNEIEEKARAAGIRVIRPSLPFDVLSKSVGGAEDAFISMISALESAETRSCVLLDDIDTILESDSATHDAPTSNSSGPQIQHQTARLKSHFQSLLDLLEVVRPTTEADGSKRALICTAKNKSAISGRFDKVSQLAYPDDAERLKILAAGLVYITEEDAKELIAWLVASTSGLSRSEVAQISRQALLLSRSTEPGVSASKVVKAIKDRIQLSMSTTLKTVAGEDFADMKIYTARDLLKAHRMQTQTTGEYPHENLSLFGENAQQAWNELRRLIVLPLCQMESLDDLMFAGGKSSSGGVRKAFGGGVLLASNPGTGKSTLAHFCAAVASSMNSSVKLIDVSCTSLIHKEVGGSERALHRVFQIAKSSTPCILLMDGIENIAARRGNDNTTEGTMDRLLSTLLTELDGVDDDTFSGDDNPAATSSSSRRFCVIGMTHNHEWIDPALRRPGRLERVVTLSNPEKDARKRIVLRELEGTHIVVDNDSTRVANGNSDDAGAAATNLALASAAETVAAETEGCSGAEVVAVCDEAKLLAVKAHFLAEENLTTMESNISSPCLTPSMLFGAIRGRRNK